MPQDSWYLAKEVPAGGVGKFLNPYDVAVGPDGNLYVADSSNQRIQVLSAEGTPIRSWNGSQAGVPNGSFSPYSVDVTADGKVYVADNDNHRVLVFDAQGKFLRAMGQQGSNEGQLRYPRKVSVDAAGNVYVGDENDRVTVFDPQGAYLRRFGGSGSGDGQFNYIYDIRALPNGKIAVFDGSRIQMFNQDGTFASKVSGMQGYTFAIDGSGNYFTADWNGQISKYSSTGTLQQTYDRSANIRSSYGMDISGDRIYVADTSNNRIAILDTAGDLIATRGSRGDEDTASVYGIAVDAIGNTFLADFDTAEIRKYNPGFGLLKKFGSAGSGNGQLGGVRSLAVGPNQKLYALEETNNRVQIFDLEGNYTGKFGGPGSGNGQFNMPSGIAVGKDNKVYVADRDNHRVQIFDANGTYLGKFGKEGSFDGEFKSPRAVAVFTNGNIAVADHGNKRIQIFDADGKFLRKENYFNMASNGLPGVSNGNSYNNPEFVQTTKDGLVIASASTYSYSYQASYNGSKEIDQRSYGYPLVITDSLLSPIKGWWQGQPRTLKYIYSSSESHYSYTRHCAGPVAEATNGDLIAANGDGVLRVWKRTFRTVHPEPANALPLPTIVSQKRRPGTSLVDVDYTVKDADNTTVQAAALAFKNAGNSLADVIPITSFAEGTGSKLGTNIATGQTHKFTWDVARDWSTDFGEVQLEILAKDGRGLLNLDFIQIPATGNQTALKISRSPLNDTDFLSVWYWLIATGDTGIRFQEGKVLSSDGTTGPIHGLTGTYFEGWNFSGNNTIKYDSIPSTSSSSVSTQISGVPFLVRSIRWNGEFVPQKSGQYIFTVSRSGNFTASIGGSQFSSTNFTVSAQAGTSIPVEFQITTSTSNGTSRNLSVNITPPGEVQRGLLASDFRTFTNNFAIISSTTYFGRAYLFQKMGLREATADEVLRAKEAGTPGVINQWDPKLRVGPDERPSKINAYGFDTGGSGYWVVPVTETN
jgi:tripartite motif-containing protein 71